MNLIRDNYNDKRQNNSIITVIIVTILILAVVAVLLGVLVNSLKNKTFKFYVNNTSANVSETVFTEIDGVRYINIKTIANVVNYEYNNGEYNNPYQEDKTKCYVKCDNEIASFIAGSNKMYKVILPEKIGDAEELTNKHVTKTNEIEYFELDNEIKVIGGEIFATEQAISIGFNIYFNYDKATNKVQIYTLPYLVEQYSKNEGVALDETTDFSNKKLVLYNMVLVKNSSGEYGVNKLSTGESILGTKYAKIKFIESSMNFIVTTEDGKQGISSTTETKITPQYDELNQLDKNLDLYIVKNDNKYGVINGNDEIVIHMEYDKIGIDTMEFINNNIENQYILYEKYLPVQRDGKWGLMNLNGQIALPVEYDSIGCKKGPSVTKTENNLLLIPEVQGIVVCKNEFYGLMTPQGTKLVPVSLTEMYKVTNAGKNTYYMTYNEQKINVLDWIEAKSNQTVTEQPQTQEQTQVTE